LGLLPYFLIFIASVSALLRMGLIVDNSLLAAWYHHDPGAAWSWPTNWKGRVFAYKVHTILCRSSYLLVFFNGTPPEGSQATFLIGMASMTF
jgi:hypothetical protein